MRLVLPAIARARRAGIGPAGVTLPPVASQYWGSYAANPTFSNAGLPASIQTYDSEAVSVWNDVWATEEIAGYTGTTLQVLSLKFNAYDHRAGVPHAFGVMDAAWMTGNPAYLTHAESYVTNMLSTLTGSYSRADIFGGRMYDPDKQTFPAEAYWTAIRLNEPNAYACLALYTRLLHENGVNPSLVATATTRLQEHWRRWQKDAWGTLDWSATATPDPSASLTHDDPDPWYRNFTHPLSCLAATAWTLYKLTDNANYQVGMTKLLEWLGLGIGHEQGVTPERATFVHMPNGGWSDLGYRGQPIEYVNHGLPDLVHYLDRENAWGTTWPSFAAEAIGRGVAYYAFRDAGSFSDSLRRDMAGGGYEDPIVTTPWTAGGTYHEPDGSFIVSSDNVDRYTIVRPYPPIIPYSDWYRTYLLGKRTANDQDYWQAPGIVAGFIEYELRQLT